MTVSALLLLPLVSALAQDGHNLYKDIHRGKVELESIAMDEDHEIDLDLTSHTWPSAGARVQVVGGAKRTLGRQKDYTLDTSTEDEDSDDSDEKMLGRALIPRTLVLLRELDGIEKPKRGTFLRSSASGLGFARNTFWLLDSGKTRPQTWYKTYVDSAVPSICKVVISPYRPHRTLLCNWWRSRPHISA